MATPRAVSVRRLNALLLQAREPLLLLDDARRLVFANRAWEQLTGHTAESVIGLVCQPAGPGGDRDRDGLAASFCPPPEALDGRPASGTTLIVRPDGERLWRRLEFWPLHEAPTASASDPPPDPGDGHLAGLLVLVRAAHEPPHAPESDSQRLRSELLEIRQRLIDRWGTDALVGRGPSHARLQGQIALAASGRAPVLVVGEPGTGKRLVARQIHQRGGHAPGAWLHFDPAVLPPELLARELFGRPLDPAEPGPPLGLAPGTTLVLGDVVDLPRDLQAHLAAGLESSPVRLIGLSASDPDQARRDERLRPDLYYALTGLVIRLAPLRERLDDLPLLAQHCLDRANERGDRRRHGFTPEALEVLAGYDWPGNVRELSRVVDAAHGRAEGDLIGPGDLPTAIRGHLGGAYAPPAGPLRAPAPGLDATLELVERRLIETALMRARHNKSRAAEILEISRPRLYRRIKELGLPDLPEGSEEPVGAPPPAGLG